MVVGVDADGDDGDGDDDGDDDDGDDDDGDDDGEVTTVTVMVTLMNIYRLMVIVTQRSAS